MWDSIFSWIFVFFLWLFCLDDRWCHLEKQVIILFITCKYLVLHCFAFQKKISNADLIFSPLFRNHSLKSLVPSCIYYTRTEVNLYFTFYTPFFFGEQIVFPVLRLPILTHLLWFVCDFKCKSISFNPSFLQGQAFTISIPISIHHIRR